MTIEIHSSTWTTIEEWAQAEIKKEQAKLAHPTVSDKVADQCRGELLALNKLLKLPTKLPLTTGQY